MYNIIRDVHDPIHKELLEIINIIVQEIKKKVTGESTEDVAKKTFYAILFLIAIKITF